MPILWDGDGSFSDQVAIENNLLRLVRHLQARAPYRQPPTVGMARGWHRVIFNNVRPPVPYYVGGIRDSNPHEPELIDNEVAVIGPATVVSGVPASSVKAELAQFQASLRTEVTKLDGLIPARTTIRGTDHIEEVLNLAADTHGEWVRIHPFVNANGRTARLWANWIALRYGLPAFIRLRPRPSGNTYASAAERSMHGDHQYMRIEFHRMFRDYLAGAHAY